MSECGLVISQLTLYVDEQLEPDRRIDVERHLDGCVSCRGVLARERGGQTVLRRCAPLLREEPLPPGLRSRCQSLVREQARAASLPGWRRTIVPTVLSAILLVFTASAIFSLATRRSDAVLAAQLTADHSKCFKMFVAGNPPVMDAHEVEEMLVREYGWKIHVPPSVDGLQLIGARRCLYDERCHAQAFGSGDVRASVADLDEEQYDVRAGVAARRKWSPGRRHSVHDERSRPVEGPHVRDSRILPGADGRSRGCHCRRIAVRH
jgi:anti-sigma factor RsiW